MPVCQALKENGTRCNRTTWRNQVLSSSKTGKEGRRGIT